MVVDQSLIIDQRKQRNWTQQHLADACGISLRTVQRVERDGQASNETVQGLNAVLDIELSQQSQDITKKATHQAQIDKPVWLQALPLMVALVTGIFLGALLAVLVLSK